MGDLPEDAHVSGSPKNPEVTFTVGFLNEKVEKTRLQAVPLSQLSLLCKKQNLASGKWPHENSG